ncbi:bifunctional aldehyde/alcohol dehydrogenase [Xenorhabdus mauleonii]|uniref:Bifunctional aldehyde/alcohol dehydrogenase n=1 Tax=Xenorhabdus mauleonii TaxID=351675 RepID=A0A1I3QHL3_9GAMM|nr:alcohol dehydrogenase [Xenorhabdus mauleonii]PHM39962.1 bifunctional aldehyde/alcohol dehydrogenase [Xenorhabdus mauleonii]SFJ33270.1 NADP-dependent alcohol dehydrogenase [Xenorhabdus mauleonii]
MQNFTLHTPTKVIFGKGQIAQLSNEIPKDAKILLIYGGGSIKHNGVLSQVHAALEGYSVELFGGIEPNPAYETLIKAVEYIHQNKIDYLLAVGGGSVIDGTKFIAAAAKYPGADPWEIMTSGGAHITSAIPFSCVLTLPATGSETNNISVISRRETDDKLHFASPFVYPQVAILDPAAAFSLPPRQVANGIVDAFVHTLEQYLTYPVNAKVQDRYAEGLLMTLLEEGPKALEEPENYDVRANIMWSATQALNGVLGAGVPQDWATHMLAHQLTAFHGLDHAQTLAIILPQLLQEKRDVKHDKLLQYAERVWNLTEGSEDERIDKAIYATRQFFESLGIKTHLSDYQLDGSSIPAMVNKLEQQGLVSLGEHQDITLDISKRIYEASI